MMRGVSMCSFSERAAMLHREQMTKTARLRLARNLPEATSWIGRHAKSFSGEAQEALNRLLNPIHGLRAGWADLTPRTQMLADKAKEMKSAINAPRTWYNPLSWLKPGEHMTRHYKAPVSLSGIMSGSFEGPHAKHLAKELAGKGRIRMTAEELSRRGWTGKGTVTKYLPVGSKGMMTGFSALAIPEVVNAQKATPTGERGALEAGLGGLGSAAGMIAGSGVGLLPGIGLWYAMDKGGRKAGRVLDRLRSGATLGEATLAPSPEEATQQLQSINQYYGPKE